MRRRAGAPGRRPSCGDEEETSEVWVIESRRPGLGERPRQWLALCHGYRTEAQRKPADPLLTGHMSIAWTTRIIQNAPAPAEPRWAALIPRAIVCRRATD